MRFLHAKKSKTEKLEEYIESNHKEKSGLGVKASKLIISSVFICMSLVIFTGCGKSAARATVSGLYFDTFISITAYDNTDNGILQNALSKCEDYELIFSKTNEQSELYKINSRMDALSDDAHYRTQISKDMYDVISQALELSEDTDGAYNPALGSVIELWDYRSENPIVPTQDVIDAALLHTDVAAIHLYEKNIDDVKAVDANDSLDVEEASNSAGKDENVYILEIDDDELVIDLGGIAKGYIANQLRDYLIEKGCKEAVIALGGNIYCIGDKAGEGYNVGIQKPFANLGENEMSVNVSDTSVVTSGIYERYFEIDNHIYHHIIDSSNGYPVDNDLASVTVICKDSLKADVLSTALLCMGNEGVADYVKKYNESSGDKIKVILISRDGIVNELD